MDNPIYNITEYKGNSTLAGVILQEFLKEYYIEPFTGRDISLDIPDTVYTYIRDRDVLKAPFDISTNTIWNTTIFTKDSLFRILIVNLVGKYMIVKSPQVEFLGIKSSQVFTVFSIRVKKLSDLTLYTSSSVGFSISNLIHERLSSRYITADINAIEPYQFLDKYIVSNYHSKYVLDKIANASKYKSNRVISRNFGSMFNLNVVPMQDLIKLVGYTIPTIKSMLKKVKELQYDVTFLGYGGTNSNTLHWLYEMCMLCKVKRLFKAITIIDEDNLDFTNLFRFPMQSNELYPEYYTKNIPKISAIPKYIGRVLSANKVTTANDSISRRRYLNYLRQRGNNSVFYGAIDLDSRQSFYEEFLDYKGTNFGSTVEPFISATHSGDTYTMQINPKIDRHLTLESYGVINLNTFFLNQVKMAIEFLEILIDINSKDNSDLNNILYKSPIQLDVNKIKGV